MILKGRYTVIANVNKFDEFPWVVVDVKTGEELIASKSAHMAVKYCQRLNRRAQRESLRGGLANVG
jgi:hypothetical protein